LEDAPPPGRHQAGKEWLDTDPAATLEERAPPNGDGHLQVTELERILS
jgi:hypothetical protein